jgi:hypothetical protein
MIRSDGSDKAIAILFALCALLPASAGAQEAPTNPPINPPTNQCWEVVSRGTGAAQPFPILVNKCTGKTWLLAKVNTQEPKDGMPGAYAYRWRPITSDDNGEITFSPTLP